MIITSKIYQEELDIINKRLTDNYGKCEPEGLPNYRIVWSDDQFEKRKIAYTNSGIALLHPEVRIVPKYRQWVQHKYILERLTVIGEYQESDLIEYLSYEPIFVFEDKYGNALKPLWDAIHFIMENVMANMKGGYTKYKDPDSNPEEAAENKKQRIDKLMEDLFGNETTVGTALAHNEAVIVPNKEFK